MVFSWKIHATASTFAGWRRKSRPARPRAAWEKPRCAKSDTSSAAARACRRTLTT
jgi:hypothetical protein